MSDENHEDMLGAWGKARNSAGGGPSWHPLAYHCLDVAAVAHALLTNRPVTRARASKLLGVDEAFAHQLLVTFAAHHDIGKFAPVFQSKATPQDWKWPSGYAALSEYMKSRGHTTDGLILWDEHLADAFSGRLWPGLSSYLLKPIACAVFGHHGRPIDTSQHSPVLEDVYCAGALKAATSFSGKVFALAPHAATPEEPTTSAQLKMASWWVAGFMTLADWIGSSQEYFPYTQPDANDPSLDGYWRGACEKAAQAVQAAGLTPPAVSRRLGYQALTKLSTPTPLQIQTEEVNIGSGSLLAIIEDATGAGKTEAAQMLVHGLLSENRASGAFWGMPTQATANAMYDRQVNMLAGLFAPSAHTRPSLVLSHGRANLDERFSRSILPNFDVLGGDASISDEVASEAACPAFMADDRRAGLLADIGVGTVDQAFLGVLPTRFNTLRLFALSEKVLVLDEVHAFDEYMHAEALGLLRMQSALGGSAILLSATLPAAQKREMLDAWCATREPLRDPETAAVEESESAYPLLTIVREAVDAREDVRFESPSWSHRSVPIHWLREGSEAVGVVVNAARAGACVVWIRNTVSSCISAAATLTAEGMEPLIFHSRFTPVDRQRIETQVLKQFGRESKRADRNGCVLVATQVVEQSLDIDFDVMVSDIAPIDLLIQRVGRLWRHSRSDGERPEGLVPKLHVLSAPADREPDATWVSAACPGTEFVYADAGVLWRTVRVLEDRGSIDSPGGLRSLIESVYGASDVPPALQASADKAQGQAYSALALGRQNVLKEASGYGGMADKWSSDVSYPTRLGDPTAVLRLAVVNDCGEVSPWCRSHEGPGGDWYQSEIRVRLSQLRGERFVPADLSRKVESLRQTWPLYDRDKSVVVLKGGGSALRDVWSAEGDKKTFLTYSRALGLDFHVREDERSVSSGPNRE